MNEEINIRSFTLSSWFLKPVCLHVSQQHCLKIFPENHQQQISKTKITLHSEAMVTVSVNTKQKKFNYSEDKAAQFENVFNPKTIYQ